jgi:hypothetical protein
MLVGQGRTDSERAANPEFAESDPETRHMPTHRLVSSKGRRTVAPALWP